MSFIRTGLRKIGLKIRRQRTRMILRHEKRLLQKSEILLGREGTSQASNFPELRNEIVALKKLEQEQKEVASRIAQIEEGIKKIETQRTANAKEQTEAMAKLETEKKPILQRRNEAKSAADEELPATEKNMGKVRGEEEEGDKACADNIRAQRDAVREAKQHHQVVEERKNPAYLNIGRHLATRGIAPPNAPHLLEGVRKHRVAVDRHQQHNDELALLSAAIDKQELRQFYFSVVSVIAFLAIILPLVRNAPRKREWLPQQTEAILSINTDQFERDDMPKRWRKEQPDVWQNLWSGLIGPAARVPALNLSRDTVRITRATTSSNDGTVREFILIENRGDVSQVIRAARGDKEFHKRTLSGVHIWEKPDLALAQVAPATHAGRTSTAIDQLG